MSEKAKISIKQLEDGKESLKKAIESNDIEAIKKEKETVQAVVYEVSAELYKQNPEEANADAANATQTDEKADTKNNDDTVVDADFSEVKK